MAQVTETEIAWHHRSLQNVEWVFVGDTCLYVLSALDTQEGTRFSIDWRTPDYARWLKVNQKKTKQPVLYDALATAQAACEQHRATGKWTS